MILGVAIKRDDKIYKMAKPARHYQLIKHVIINEELTTPILQKEQGFYDDFGSFMTRKQAYEHAQFCKQFADIPIKVGELFSEDVW